MIQRIADLDFQILLWIQQNIRGEDATDFWESMMDLGNLGAIWLAIALALLVYRRTRLCGAAAMLAIVLNTVVSNVILKNWVARPRPFLTHPELHPLIHLPTDFSFPSGHTSCAFAVAFVICAMLPKRYSIPALLMAAFVGLSRLYLGVHYPTDVLAGMFIGLGVAKLSVWIVHRCAGRWR